MVDEIKDGRTRTTQIGVVSWGPASLGCGNDQPWGGTPDVFTRVSYFVKWIIHHVND